MIRAFLDTNVIVDYLAKREKFYENAAIIISLAKHKKIKIYVASMSFATASYLMAKHYHNDASAIKLAISNFIKLCNITVVDRTTIEDSIASAFDDFEDGMQYSCASKSKANFIVTRNKVDFKESSIAVVEPGEFLNAKFLCRIISNGFSTDLCIEEYESILRISS